MRVSIWLTSVLAQWGLLAGIVATWGLAAAPLERLVGPGNGGGAVVLGWFILWAVAYLLVLRCPRCGASTTSFRGFQAFGFAPSRCAGCGLNFHAHTLRPPNRREMRRAWRLGRTFTAEG